MKHGLSATSRIRPAHPLRGGRASMGVRDPRCRTVANVGLGEELRGPLAEDLGEHVPLGRQWQGAGNRGSFVHGGVLQCLVGSRVG
jgi:hypothetical protein